MKFVLYNRLGILDVCATVCLSLPVMLWQDQRDTFGASSHWRVS